MNSSLFGSASVSKRTQVKRCEERQTMKDWQTVGLAHKKRRRDMCVYLKDIKGTIPAKEFVFYSVQKKKKKRET